MSIKDSSNIIEQQPNQSGETSKDIYDMMISITGSDHKPIFSIKTINDKFKIKICIITWNIGGNTFQNLKDQFKKIIDKIYEKNNENAPDLIIFGLQELNTPQINIFEKWGFVNRKILENIENKWIPADSSQTELNVKYLSIDTKKPLITCEGSFRIATFIFYNKNNNLWDNCRLTINENKCFNSMGEESVIQKTKGYLLNTIRIGNSLQNKVDFVDISFLNCHLPFKSVKESINFIKKINKTIEFIPNNIFLFGDINSRSLFLDESESETPNDLVELCKKPDFKKYTLPNQQPQSCNLTPSSFHEVYSCLNEKDPSNLDKKLIDELVKKDSLKCQQIKDLTPFPKDFSEEEITFLPSYKFDKKGNNYKLSKKKQNKTYGRLPGYTDRIFHNKGNKDIKNLLECLTKIGKPFIIKDNDLDIIIYESS